jgi:molybdopterin-containing oxidoreductase family iron-sulfur binding subunit
MHVFHTDGRSIKAEGNPDHPVSGGGLCPRGQAALQGLYDPDRIRAPITRAGGAKGFEVRDWVTALPAVAQVLSAAAGRVVVISDVQTGALAEVTRAFASTIGARRTVMYEPFSYDGLREAHRALLGKPIIPRYDLSKAASLISFGADFLETWVSNVEFARQFASFRQFRNGAIAPFVYVGPRMSMTATNADLFIPLAPDKLKWAALAVLESMIPLLQGLSVKYGPLVSRARAMGSAQALDRSGLSERQMEALLAALTPRGLTNVAASMVSPPVALAGSPVGGAADSELCMAAAMLNGFAAFTEPPAVNFAQPHALSASATSAEVEALIGELGPRDVLVLLSSNPAYRMPHLAHRMRQAGTIIAMGTMLDESAAMADWVLPVHSPLESWGDYEPWTGVHCLQQPTMAPVFDTRHAGDVLIELAAAMGKPISRPGADAQAPGPTSVPGAPWAHSRPAPQEPFHQWLRGRWREMHSTIGSTMTFEDFWRSSLGRGFVEAASPRQPDDPLGLIASEGRAATTAPATSPTTAPAASEGERLWLWGSVMLHDGRVANHSWLQENPEPVSQLTWGNCADISPEHAKALDVRTGDNVTVGAGGTSITLPARVTHDVAAGVVAVSLGCGQAQLGRNAGVGANAFVLARAQGSAATVAKANGSAVLAMAAAERDQHERHILKWIGAGKLAAPDAKAEELALPLAEGWSEDRDILPGHDHRKMVTAKQTPHRWAMVVDLHRCIGCGACAVACYAENNLQVVGHAEVAKGRELAWLKVVPYQLEGHQSRLGWLPMLCQHCDSAPCEPVCPVFAAAHNEEGLNVQIYNRCIGTRYCANNCPYKVRKFNWFDPKWERQKPLNVQLNPDVTVRSRGVMEKCTFCVQRIRRAQHEAALQNRPLRDGEIMPACAQSCPAGVYTFGDLLDANSAVARLVRTDPRRYQVLKELNTKPAVIYLKRIAWDH